MAAFRDLSEVLDPGLPLPIGGTTYTVPPVNAETGLRLQRLSDWMFGVAAAAHHEQDSPEPSREVLTDAEELDLYRSSLGTSYEEMVADGIPWAHLKVAGMTAFLYATVGAEQAQQYWDTGGNPEGQAGNRASRRAARSTPPPDSASGTRQSRAKTAPATENRSPGRKSSNSGR